MKLKFQPMSMEHSQGVMDIFNFYIEQTSGCWAFTTYLEQKLPESFFVKFLEMTKGYPAYVLKDGDTEKILGFSFLRAYNPMPVFRGTAEISYFFSPDAVGKGYGEAALAKMEREGLKQGIQCLLASISSYNEPSLKFHAKNGFSECGRFRNVGIKRGVYFDVVWMEKSIYSSKFI